MANNNKHKERSHKSRNSSSNGMLSVMYAHSNTKTYHQRQIKKLKEEANGNSTE